MRKPFKYLIYNQKQIFFVRTSVKRKLKGVEPADGEDMYKIIIGKKTAFFNVTSGLKHKDIITSKSSKGKERTQVITYSKYTEYNGILFPKSMIITFGPRILDFKIIEVKVNENVADKDFE